MELKFTSADERAERRFRDALHAAMGLLGWLVPDIAAVVIAKNQDVERTPKELPTELRDPLAILDRERQAAHSDQEMVPTRAPAR